MFRGERQKRGVLILARFRVKAWLARVTRCFFWSVALNFRRAFDPPPDPLLGSITSWIYQRGCQLVFYSEPRVFLAQRTK
jgi:hypothetical protein